MQHESSHRKTVARLCVHDRLLRIPRIDVHDNSRPTGYSAISASRVLPGAKARALGVGAAAVHGTAAFILVLETPLAPALAFFRPHNARSGRQPRGKGELLAQEKDIAHETYGEKQGRKGESCPETTRVAGENKGGEGPDRERQEPQQLRRATLASTQLRRDEARASASATSPSRSASPPSQNAGSVMSRPSFPSRRGGVSEPPAESSAR